MKRRRKTKTPTRATAKRKRCIALAAPLLHCQANDIDEDDSEPIPEEQPRPRKVATEVQPVQKHKTKPKDEGKSSKNTTGSDKGQNRRLMKGPGRECKESKTQRVSKEEVPKTDATTKREKREVETKRRSTVGGSSGSGRALPKGAAEKERSKVEEKVKRTTTPGEQTEGYIHERLPMVEVDQHKQRWRLEVRNSNKDNQSLLMRKVTGTPMQMQVVASSKEANLQGALQFMMGVFHEVINMTSPVTKPQLEEKKRLFLAETTAQPPCPKTPAPADHPYTKQRSSSSLAS
eukprot:3206517-Amphidinium_carterae.1